jgi:hypothetical protein
LKTSHLTYVHDLFLFLTSRTRTSFSLPFFSLYGKWVSLFSLFPLPSSFASHARCSLRRSAPPLTCPAILHRLPPLSAAQSEHRRHQLDRSSLMPSHSLPSLMSISADRYFRPLTVRIYPPLLLSYWRLLLPSRTINQTASRQPFSPISLSLPQIRCFV